MNKITRTPLTSGDSARYEKVTGVTYFKLKSEFPGDYTKNCGLLAEEMDGNFYFLRGYDIDTITLDDERNLVITRVDKDYAPMKVSLNEEFKKTTFEFDKENGSIIVTYPDGTTDSVDGFLVAGKDVKMATDNTIDGDGTLYNPLRLSGIEKTGTYAPAEKFVDISNSTMGRLPEGEYRGQRIVSKEKIDTFGMLYTMEAMEKIQSALTETGSEWRVPTKEDWDDLLNSLECAEYRNHSAISSTWLGEVAGAGMKSANLWSANTAVESGNCLTPAVGRDIIGLTVLPVGITPDRNAILQDNDADVEGFEKMAGMWSQTKNPEGNAFVKIFGYNHPEVFQDTYGVGARLSLRFVKEYTYDNNNEIEEILGIPVPTQLVYSIHDDYQYAKVWTKVNFYSNEYDGVTYKGWSAATDEDRGVKIVYYINEYYDGRWHKKMMNEGDSVVIIDYAVSGGDYSDQDYSNDYSTSGATIRYHEWRVINGELVDTLESVMGEFSSTLKELTDKINTLSAITEEFSGATVESLNWLDKKIEEEKERAEAVENAITERIENEENRALEAEKALDSAIKNEEFRALSAETVLHNEIVEEQKRAIGVEDSLKEAIAAEESRAIAAERELDAKIKAETLQREANDYMPGQYVLYGESESEMVIPTNGEEVDDIRIKVSDDFFNFGTF